MLKNLGLIFICFMVIPLAGEFVAVNSTEYSDIFNIEPEFANEITVSFSLDGYETEVVTIDGIDYQRISHPAAGDLLKIGRPDLPVFSQLLAIPDKGSVTWEINYQEEEIINFLPVLPRQELQSESSREAMEFTIDQEFYNSDQIFPETVVSLEEPAILRDLRVIKFTLKPFQFNPAENNLRMVKNVTITFTVAGEAGINSKINRGKISPTFEDLYKASILNYNENSRRDEDYQQPSYLFIYADEDLLNCHPGPYDLQGIMDWKHQKGFIVHSASLAETGSSETSIKNYIQNAYLNWEDPPEYVCLVGDPNSNFDLPAGYSSNSDYGYTLLEGNDDYPEVMIGRLSVDSETDMQVIGNKILNYELNPYTTDDSWFEEVLLIGDTRYGTGYSAIGTCLYVKERMDADNPGFAFEECYSGAGYDSDNDFTNAFVNSINAGLGYVQYRGWWGMSGIDGYNMNSLSNGFMLPFITSITCDTGTFLYESVTEDLLEAGTATVPRGAIGAIGTATTGTHTCFNNIVSGGIFSGIFDHQLYTPGSSLVHGKLQLINNYPTGPNSYVENFLYWNNLMGDPGIELWTDQPQSFQVSYDSSIPLGSNFLDINVENTSGRPIENAWVTVLMGNDIIFTSDYTDATGNVNLEINAEQLGTLTVTVSKHDFIPHTGTISVVQEDLFLSVFELNIDDDNSGTSQGNDDGLINPGEEIELGVSLKNYGSSNANSVTAVISTSEPGVEISDANESYGNINSGSSAYSTDDFDLTIPNNVVGGSLIELDLTINGNSREQWNSIIELPVHGLNFNVSGYTVLDGNNAILDPGETTELTVTLHNLGTISGSNIQAQLSSSDPGLTIIDQTGSYGTIGVGAEVTNIVNTYSLECNDQVIPGTQITCSLTITDGTGFEQQVSFLLAVGDINLNHPTGPDTYGYYIYDDGDTQFSLVPYYNWIEIDPDLGGSGTSLNLSDSGENGSTAEVALPFNFYFYGIRYNSLTVCSNGWVAPGSTEQFDFMNWQIPGALGPSPMIAPFWDDLMTTNGGQVYYFHDNTAHRFIVEWSGMKNHYDSSEETFQLILYDEDYYETTTGDGEILFQYKEINNSDQGNYPSNHGQFATAGIEDHTALRGNQYTFNNTYPASAKELTDEMAILFTTNSASVVAPPEAGFSHSVLDFIVAPQESDSQQLTITNNGEANLVYNISKAYVDSRSIEPTRDEGGPDSYGYEWIDSNELNGPDFDWVDITGVGTELFLIDDDSEVIALPFDFEFYGDVHSSVRISSNGYLTFGSSGNDYSNNAIPDGQTPNDLIAPFWDDLKPIGGEWGTVYYYSDVANDRFIIEYYQASHWTSYSPRDPETFEVILYSNGKIKFQYLIATDESDHTVGIENQSGSDGLQIAYYDGSYLQNELAIEISTVVDWAQVDPASGSIPTGTQENIIIDVETAELELGDYVCDLYVTTNDPNSSIVIIPVNLTVTEYFLEAPENINIDIVADTIHLDWDDVMLADSYKVYASSRMDLPFEEWTLVQAGITESHVYLPLSAEFRFFKIMAISN